jgi:hypothetical protein
VIRNLRLTDLPSLLLPGRLGGEDLTCTRGELGAEAHRISPAELARWSISTSEAQQPLVAIRGGKLEAVGLLRARQGPRSWEVAHLFNDGGHMDDVTMLLERAVAYVGSRGAERLFIRVPLDSPVQTAAKHAGFYLAFTEEVFALDQPMMVDPSSPALRLRPPLPTDTYDLFRLYNFTLPPAVRAAAGLTLDQWLDSREHSGNRVRDYVWEHDGQLRGWIRFDHTRDVLTLDAVLHPEESAAAPMLVTYAARLAWSHSMPLWVVPSYQPAIGRSLQQHGWQVRQTYAVLIRPAASRVLEPSFAPVQA